MMSDVAFFVNNVIGPIGSVHIVDGDNKNSFSDDIDSHTKTNRLKIHYLELDNQGNYLMVELVLQLGLC